MLVLILRCKKWNNPILLKTQWNDHLPLHVRVGEGGVEGRFPMLKPNLIIVSREKSGSGEKQDKTLYPLKGFRSLSLKRTVLLRRV